MRQWLVAALTLVITSGELPFEPSAQDISLHKPVINVPGSNQMLTGHVRLYPVIDSVLCPNSSNEKATAAVKIQRRKGLGHCTDGISQPETDQLLFYECSKDMGPTAVNERNVIQAEALIRAPRLSRIASNQRSAEARVSKTLHMESMAIPAATAPNHDALLDHGPDLETSSAPPPGKGTIDGRRTLAEMSVGLSVVCFIFIFWM
ncbi:uncharacterized protein B0I36DRAFT_6566 [Microdochium trichocladiopsis]|uniref:Uncharacterized protein n=1 Tax=Microdochium trichocladiopsis TaxID=1682393 RepID=A0A9P8YE71_9PEZI|nr:uncharacterized protein B0I36DRAFT_6566 [Microdochium trichocladiopsis]KAH7040157.1 hypothetical protein B0I36DRAFT_6566 [Microdochium trichocladiopsis]